MIRQKYTLNLVNDKPKKLAVLRAVLLFTVAILLMLVLTGVVVFSCVHGTAI